MTLEIYFILFRSYNYMSTQYDLRLLPVFVMTFAAYEHCTIRHKMTYVFLPVFVMTFAAYEHCTISNVWRDQWFK